MLAHLASLLTILLAVTWTVSLFYFFKLHQLELSNHIDRHETQTQYMNIVKNTPARNTEDNPSADVHIVFSTDCSGYQHWQSLASYYSFRRAGHLGPITRIVSGCRTPREEEAIRSEFQKIQQSSTSGDVDDDRRRPQLRLHFTPSFALGGKHYKYSNKPGGLWHWMNHNETALDEPVVALVDPDMMALRPIFPYLGEGMTASPVTVDGYRDLVEYKDQKGRIMLLRRANLPPLPPRVKDGVGAGQHFGLGGFWASSGTSGARPDFKEFNLTAVCGAYSPCLNTPPKKDEGRTSYTTREAADKNYAVGPVYIASTSDWIDLLPRWHDFTPRVHAQYPKLLAEMYAFTMSAADMQLNFALSSSYMASDPKTMSTTEAWMWIDGYAAAAGRQSSTDRTLNVCEGAASTSLPMRTLERLSNYGFGCGAYHNQSLSENSDRGPLPTVLHYCQTYKYANHTFAKRKMPHDFFRCGGEPLAFDVDALLSELDTIRNDSKASATQKKKETRTVFMLCHLIPMMNMALEEYKLDVCGGH